MTGQAGKRTGGHAPSTIELRMTPAEVQLLKRIAPYYQKSMGPLRVVVRLASPRDVRTKYRFITEESNWLRTFAEAVLEDMEGEEAEEFVVRLTPRALVAFWGRLLSSLNSRRSRRRLSAAELAARSALSEKLEATAREAWAKSQEVIELEIATRKRSEAEWMRQKLDPASNEVAAGGDAGPR